MVFIIKGYINNIFTSSYGSECGFITVDDGTSYYLDSRSLDGAKTMAEYNIDDQVEFNALPPIKGKKYGVAKNVVLTQSGSTEDVENSLDSIDIANATVADEIACTTVVDSIPKENSDGIINFFPKGLARHLDKKYLYQQFLKKGSDEDVIIDKLSRILYISKIGHHIIDQSSRYQFCLIGATSLLKQYVRGKYEFLAVLSHFDNVDWQQKSLIVEREIRKRREIADRRPLVNFYLLISNAENLKEEIDKIKGSTGAAVIPFAFEEILKCKTDGDLSTLIVKRFGEYLFENNMLGETSAIDDDNLLFGDRGKIADSIVYRCQKLSNSGIFGLRRSGKTSVLNAVLRRLDRENIKYVRIESRSDLENLDSWKTALYDTSKKIRQSTLSIQQESEESRVEFAKRLNLNSTEEDYQKRPSQYFVEDIKLYCKDEHVFVIAIDEVELITYNTAKTTSWKNVEAYCGFWGALRDCGCALIVCGVNSTINEINTISFNGIQGDNPMYGRIIGCADFSSTYLPVFTDEQTKYMLNTLGGYSNVAYSNIYAEINRAFGGQPYAVRQFGSFVFERVKELRKPTEIYEVSKATVENLLTEFGSSSAGNIILQHLTIFSDEYEMLKKLALSPDKYKTIHEQDISNIDHLQKYGLIEYDYTTYYVSFKIHSIKDYLKKTSTKDPMDMTNDERRKYVQDCVVVCETKLKTYIRDYYIYTNTESACRALLKSYIGRSGAHKPVMVNNKAVPKPNPDSCAFKDFFDHKKFIMYFSSIKTIIRDKWSTLGTKFSSFDISKEKFCSCMDDMNAGRNDADHYDAEDTTTYPDGWEIDNVTMQNFIVSHNTINRFFEICNL